MIPKKEPSRSKKTSKNKFSDAYLRSVTIDPPWIFDNKGTRSHFYDSIYWFGHSVRIRGIRLYDIEGTEDLRWRIALRHQKALKKYQKAHCDLKGLSRAQHNIVLKDKVVTVEHRFNKETETISTDFRNRSVKNPINAGRALRYYRSSNALSFWWRCLSLTDTVLTRAFQITMPRDVRKKEKGITILQVNKRDYVFLVRPNRHGVPTPTPYHYPTPKEPNAITKTLVPCNAILESVMTRTLLKSEACPRLTDILEQIPWTVCEQ